MMSAHWTCPQCLDLTVVMTAEKWVCESETTCGWWCYRDPFFTVDEHALAQFKLLNADC